MTTPTNNHRPDGRNGCGIVIVARLKLKFRGRMQIQTSFLVPSWMFVTQCKFTHIFFDPIGKHIRFGYGMQKRKRIGEKRGERVIQCGGLVTCCCKMLLLASIESANILSNLMPIIQGRPMTRKERNKTRRAARMILMDVPLIAVHF